MARRASRTTPNIQHRPLRGTDFERHRSIVVLGDDARSLRRGFTIVELLIVVVVIAILAAITIAAYNGITNRAKNSAAATAAEQAAKKVMAYATLDSDQYPATLADAGVSTGSATYQYRVDNSANPKTFCVTATTQNVSYYVSHTTASPVAGACVGHGDGARVMATRERFSVQLMHVHEDEALLLSLFGQESALAEWLTNNVRRPTATTRPVRLF